MGTRDIRRAARHWATRRAGPGAPGDVPLTGARLFEQRARRAGRRSRGGRRTFSREVQARKAIAGRAEPPRLAAPRPRRRCVVVRAMRGNARRAGAQRGPRCGRRSCVLWRRSFRKDDGTRAPPRGGGLSLTGPRGGDRQGRGRWQRAAAAVAPAEGMPKFVPRVGTERTRRVVRAQGEG